MIAFELHSPNSPDLVLSALRSRAGEWRESQMPSELRRAGIRAIECKVEGASCELHYDRQWYGAWAPGQFLRARAIVEPEMAGTRVVVSVDCQLRNVGLFTLGVGASSAIAVAAFGSSALVYPLLAFGAVGLAYLWLQARSRGLSRRTDGAADYLARRIETAVADAGRADFAVHTS